jgi:hypothetical protein
VLLEVPGVWPIAGDASERINTTMASGFMGISL